MTNADFALWAGALFGVWGAGFAAGHMLYAIRRFFDLI